MAKTAFATDNALVKKAWDEKLYRDTVKESYFSRFMGEGSDAMIQTKTELTKTKGDNITFGIRMRLAGGGVTSGQTLEGKEEKLVTYSYSVSLEEYAHAVRDAGPLDRQRAMFSIDTESQAALQDWGSEKIDKLVFDALTASPTKAFYGGTASATNNIVAGSKITPALLSKIKGWAKTGGNRAQTPLRPLKVGGKNYYVFLAHPEVVYDLKQDSTWAQAQREADVRGPENAIFSGAAGIWDGVVIHEHENVPIASTYGVGANVHGAQCLFLGAQAGVFAWGERPKTVAEEFDYGREHGYGWMMTAKAAKPKFNSLDYGSVGVYVSCTDLG